MKVAALLVAVVALVAGARAQLFPPRPTDTYVVDSANLISPADKQTITAASKELLRESGAPIVVATVTSLAAVQAKDMGIEAYAHKMFDSWGIGSKSANHGILLLVAKDDHKARIELGGDWDHRYDGDSHQIMNGTVLPQFKQGHYSQGIVAGVQALKRMTEQAASETPGATAPVSGTTLPDYSESADAAEANSLVVTVFILCGVAVFVMIVGSIIAKTNAARRGNIYPSVDDTNYRRNHWSGYDPNQNDVVNTVVLVDNSSYTDNSSCDSSPSYDSGGGGFDSGSSGGGGDTGSW